MKEDSKEEQIPEKVEDEQAKSEHSKHDDQNEEGEEEQAYGEMLDEKFQLPPKALPDDKEEQLGYLLKRVDALEDLVENMKQFMLEEDEEKNEMLEELEEHERKVSEFQEREKLTISEKVKIELKGHLEASAQKLIEAEKQRDEIKMKNAEHGMLLNELDSLVITYHKEEEENKVQTELMTKMIDNLKLQGEEQGKQIDLKDGEILEKDDKIKSLTQEVEELKGVLMKLSDVRNVLNRVLDPYSKNPDKMIKEMKDGVEQGQQAIGDQGWKMNNMGRGEVAGDDFWYGAKHQSDPLLRKGGELKQNSGFLDNNQAFFEAQGRGYGRGQRIPSGIPKNDNKGYIPKIIQAKNDKLRKSRGKFRLKTGGSKYGGNYLS